MFYRCNQPANDPPKSFLCIYKFSNYCIFAFSPIHCNCQFNPLFHLCNQRAAAPLAEHSINISLSLLVVIFSELCCQHWDPTNLEIKMGQAPKYSLQRERSLVLFSTSTCNLSRKKVLFKLWLEMSSNFPFKYCWDLKQQCCRLACCSKYATKDQEGEKTSLFWQQDVICMDSSYSLWIAKSLQVLQKTIEVVSYLKQMIGFRSYSLCMSSHFWLSLSGK